MEEDYSYLINDIIYESKRREQEQEAENIALKEQLHSLINNLERIKERLIQEGIDSKIQQAERRERGRLRTIQLQNQKDNDYIIFSMVWHFLLFFCQKCIRSIEFSIFRFFQNFKFLINF